MNIQKNKLSLIVLAVTMPFLLSCLYLQRMIQVPEPEMEENIDTVLEVLSTGDWVSLQEVSTEQYTQEEYAKPGTLTFHARLTNDQSVYFNYGWCSKDEATLEQNMQHIRVEIYFNGGKLSDDVVHSLAYMTPEGQACLDHGMLLTDWPAGTYQMKADVSFDQEIDHGFGRYPAGEYIYEYNITVAQ